MEELQKAHEEVVKTAREAAVLGEQNRILREIEKADLPLSVWPLIKDIICPPDPSKQK